MHFQGPILSKKNNIFVLHFDIETKLQKSKNNIFQQ